MNRRIQARAVQANQGASAILPSGAAVELGQLFQNSVGSSAGTNRGRGRGDGRGGGRTVGRPWASFRARFTCLQDPDTEHTSSINHVALRRQGLGEYK